jgi:hypothetical protein
MPHKKITAIACLLLAHFLPGGEKCLITVSGNWLSPRDRDFRSVYGKGLLYPEIRAARKVAKNFRLWAGYGFFSKKGSTPDLESPARSTQHFLAAGAELSKRWMEKLEGFADLGLILVFYEEKALADQIKGTAPGGRIDLGLRYYFGKSFLALLSVGYMAAWDKIQYAGATVKVHPGGFRAGLGVGLVL